MERAIASRAYERLSALDAAFLEMESEAAPMNVGALALFAGTAPSLSELRGEVAARLDRVPRYRQRIATVPLGLGRPVWVDDEGFDVARHVGRTVLPRRPGVRGLRAFAAGLFGRCLDRSRPLWGLELVEGFSARRFAIVSTAHHCLLDGVSGVGLAAVLLDAEAGAPRAAGAGTFTPRPGPAEAERVADALRDQVQEPLRLAREALAPGTEGRRALQEIAQGLLPLAGMSRLRRVEGTSLNRPIGPGRVFEAVSLDLAAVKRVRTAFSATVNDVVLAVVAGALRRLLLSRGETPPRDLVVMVPVNVRGPGTEGSFGNRVAALFCRLPVGEPDPGARLLGIAGETRRRKESGQAVGTQALTRLGDLVPTPLAALVSRRSFVTSWFNLVVTNVPGPQHPLHLLGRRLLACHPCVPLTGGSTLGIALLSYDGAIDVGLLGDAGNAADLPLLSRAVPAALAELATLVPEGG